MSSSASGKVFGTVAMFGGTQIGMSTIFGLGIMPYISASIIFQLLGERRPAAREAAEGRRERPEEDQRIHPLRHRRPLPHPELRSGCSTDDSSPADGRRPRRSIRRLLVHGSISVVTMTAGTIFLMWIGEQIDEYGIGNGISLLIMAGILARMPGAPERAAGDNSTPQARPRARASTASITLAAPGGPVRGGRRRRDRDHREPAADPDPVGQARPRPPRLRRHPPVPAAAGQPGGRHADHLRLQPADASRRSSSAGSTQRGGRSTTWAGGVLRTCRPVQLRPRASSTTCCYIVLIYFFCYFWTAITFNPKDMANNLKDYGSFIPGYRPGTRTADYLEKVMLRITYVGAAFLAWSRSSPSVVQAAMDVDFHDRQLPRRHRPADRHQRLPRPGAEDRQPPDHAELRRPGEQTVSR